MNSTRIYSFDVLKFFAILAIAILHFHWQSLPQAYLGVELCFMITGFFLSIYYDKYLNQNFFDTVSKRLNSFYFYYIVAFFISSFFIGAFHFDYLLNGLFLLPEIGIGIKITPGAFWFLGAYMYAFIFYLFIIKNVDKEKINYLVGILVFLSLLAMNKISPTLCVSIERNFYIFMLPFGIVRAITGIGIGYLIGSLKCHQNTNPFIKYSDIIEIAAIIYMIYIIFHKQTYKFDILFYIISSVLIFSLAYKTSYLSKILEYCGHKFKTIFALSLPIYIYHSYINLKFGQYLINKFHNNGLYIFIYIGLVLTVAILFKLLDSKKSYIFISINKISDKLNSLLPSLYSYIQTYLSRGG